MKKLLILIIALAALSALALPPVAGNIAKDRLTTALENASDNGMVVLSLQDFDSGWYSSSGYIEARFSDGYAETLRSVAADNQGSEQLELADGFAGFLDETVILDINLQHGPVLLGDDAFIGWSAAVVQFNPKDEEFAALMDELGIPYFLKIEAYTGFDGITKFDADIPPGSYLNEIGDFSFSGLVMTGDFDGVNLNSSGYMNSFEVYGPAIRFKLDNFSVAGEQTLHPPYVWLGNTDVAIQSIRIESPDDPDITNIQLDDVGFGTELALNDSQDQVDLSINYQISRMSGPDIDLSDLNTGIQISQIELATLEQYYELNQELVFVDPAATQERMPELQAMLYKALSKSPRFALDPLEFKWNQEAFSAKITLDVHGDKLPPEQNWDPNDIEAWPNAVSVNAEASIARNLAIDMASETLAMQVMGQSTEENPITPEQAKEMGRQQAPAMLDVLTLQGMLTKTDDGFAASANFSDNILTVNGKPIPLGASQ